MREMISINIHKIQEQKEVKLLLQLLRIQNEETYNHCLRVAEITNDMINHMTSSIPWTEAEIHSILTGALIFDIGKAYLPFNLIAMSKPLTDFETEIIKTHPTLGYEIIKDVFDEIVESIVLMHHENEKGTGYPFQLCTLPDYVKLIQYADIFDSMTSYHPYKNSLTYKEAFTEIQQMVAEEKIDYIYLEDLKQFVNRKCALIDKKE